MELSDTNVGYEIWTAIENLEYDLTSEFDHIRDETESMRFEDELDAIEMVEENLLKQFPKLFKGLDINKVVDIRYESFSVDDDCVDYALYISFREDLCKRIYFNHILKHPEKVIQFLDKPPRFDKCID